MISVPFVSLLMQLVLVCNCQTIPERIGFDEVRYTTCCLDTACAMQDVAKLFLLSGLVQLIMFFMLVPSFVRSHASAQHVLLPLLAALIGAAEPGCAAVLVFVRIVTLLRLRRQGVIVSDIHRMLTAGHIDIVLFDKTGTLTNEQVSWLFLALLNHSELHELCDAC